MRYLSIIGLSVLIAGCGQAPASKQAAFTQQALRSPPVHGGAGTGEAYVNAAAFSPDNKYLITGYFSNLAAGQPGHRKRLTLWDVATGKEILSWEGHNGRVSFVGFLPHGKCAVTAGWDGTIKLWEIPSGKLVWEVKAYQMPEDSDIVVVRAALSPDGLLLLSDGSDGQTILTSKSILKLWNTKDGKLIRSFGPGGGSLAISPDSKLAISGGGGLTQPESKLQVWDLATGDTTLSLEGKDGWGKAIGFLSDELAISFKKQLVVWDISTGKITRTLDVPGGNCYLTPDKKRIMCRSYKEDDKGNHYLLMNWDIDSGKIINTTKFYVSEQEEMGTITIIFSLDGSLAFTSCRKYAPHPKDPNGQGMRNNLWDMNTGNMIRRFSAPGR